MNKQIYALFCIIMILQVPCFAMEYFLNGLSEGLKVGIGLDLKKARSQRSKEPEDKEKKTEKEKRPRKDQQLSDAQDTAKPADDGEEKEISRKPAKKRARYDGTCSSHIQFTPAEQQEIDRRIKEAELFQLIDK